MTGRVSDLSPDEFAAAAAGHGLCIQLGPFTANIQCGVEDIHETLMRFYADHPCLPSNDVFSIRVSLQPAGRFGRSKVRFTVDGRTPHEDMPRHQALPVLEWGMNLVIAYRGHSFLMLHSAVIERKGYAMLLPAAPGFGKSTLCAGLSSRGWRTFSDEFALIRPGTDQMLPVPRPIALKNESINVITEFAPDAYVGPVSRGTRKGDVAHLKPTAESVLRQRETAPVNLVVFPRWVSGAATRIEAIPRAESFMLLATNAFNYELLGEQAFLTVRDFVAAAHCFRMTYSDLEEATATLSDLQDKVIDQG